LGDLGNPADRTLSAAEVIDVVRQVVRQLAPDELDVVDPVADAWVLGELSHSGRKRGPGGAVGSGVEAVLLTQLLFPIVAGAVGDVLGTVALDPGRLKRRSSPSAADGEEAAEPAAAKPAPPVALTERQLASVHDACQRHARTLGLSAARAALLADAVVGSLSGARSGGQ
jgi:hypothetical protein